MGIEYVTEYDEDGNEVGGYTETVPDVPEQDEPDRNDPAYADLVERLDTVLTSIEPGLTDHQAPDRPDA